MDPLELNIRMVGRANDIKKHDQTRYIVLARMAAELFDAVAAGSEGDACRCIAGYLDRELTAREESARKSEAARMRAECDAWRRGVLDAVHRSADAIQLPR